MVKFSRVAGNEASAGTGTVTGGRAAGAPRDGGATLTVVTEGARAGGGGPLGLPEGTGMALGLFCGGGTTAAGGGTKGADTVVAEAGASSSVSTSDSSESPA